MSRAPYQVLVFPYFVTEDNIIEYALFKREDDKYWQGIAGGGEGKETPMEAAHRETMEESGIVNGEYIALISNATMPVVNVSGFLWGEDIIVIPEYSFGVRVQSKDIQLSKEHLEYKWVSYEEAQKSVKWDSNHSALWELNHRLLNATKDIGSNLDIIDSNRQYIRTELSAL